MKKGKQGKAVVQTAERYRYRLLLEYDGTNFSGWQKQNDTRTVQGDLLKALHKLIGETLSDLQGCGRTDSGVHALGYVAHLETKGPLVLAGLLENLNDNLPKDLSVLAIDLADQRFHARHSCVARSYRYQLLTRKSAFGKRYGWWVREELDLDLMRQGAELLVGMHDYAAFAEKPELKKSTKVLVHGVQLSVQEGQLTIVVTASHFLWRMVRRIVGVLVALGAKRISLNDLAAMLTAAPASLAGYTAPAAGLFFDQAHYSEAELQDFLQGHERD